MRKKSTLRILGGRVRYYRQLRGLSQAALAKDICTQATISLIEKRNKVPSMEILLQLVNRLGIQLADIVVEQADRNQRALNQVESLVRHGDYQAAEAKLHTLVPEKFKEPSATRRFYYFQGMVELYAHEQPEEAIYYFGRVLNPTLSNDHDLLGIMATLGFALAYANQGANERARVYVDSALALMATAAQPDQEALTVALTLNWHLAQVYYALQDYSAVLTYVRRGIKRAIAEESLFLLAELYALEALALRATGDAEAPASYEIAQSLAQLQEADAASDRLAAQWAELSA
ncbi:helix-turn-helix domain-containing protein [Lacticaseibacillus nasuensis]|uniref:helix-turn-helix domain-containing protein n=1 Tax=Lacticaseibacillus nasuensis TaxID=944671 RepID=UPI002247AEC4|nr:helix-turn-helix domain-containing protein [Lacticaseibacillus nasuensis]MCX2455342.1 helix-turn-helix transcriptional regulator [Lacticaseibacillus nasuensis]